MPTIKSIEARDFRRQLEDGAGSDAVHTNPQYGYGVTLLKADNGLTGSGLSLIHISAPTRRRGLS